jgi:predicted nuclease with TOPRIM domain
VSIPIIVGLIAGIAGALGAYLAALRKLSGTVKHSEAEELWAESKAIREDLQERNEFLRARLDKCEERIEALATGLNFLTEANTKLRDENMALKARPA